MTWTNAGLLSIGLLEKSVSEIQFRILSVSFEENAVQIVICQNSGHFVQGEMT